MIFLTFMFFVKANNLLLTLINEFIEINEGIKTFYESGHSANSSNFIEETIRRIRINRNKLPKCQCFQTSKIYDYSNLLYFIQFQNVFEKNDRSLLKWQLLLYERISNDFYNFGQITVNKWRFIFLCHPELKRCSCEKSIDKKEYELYRSSFYSQHKYELEKKVGINIESIYDPEVQELRAFFITNCKHSCFTNKYANNKAIKMRELIPSKKLKFWIEDLPDVSYFKRACSNKQFFDDETMDSEVENFDLSSNSFFHCLLIALKNFEEYYVTGGPELGSFYIFTFNSMMKENKCLGDIRECWDLYMVFMHAKEEIIRHIGKFYNYNFAKEFMVTNVGDLDLTNYLKNFSTFLQMFRNRESSEYYFTNSNECLVITPPIIKLISSLYNFAFNIFRITENGIVKYELIDKTKMGENQVKFIYDVVLILKEKRYYFVKLVKRNHPIEY